MPVQFPQHVENFEAEFRAVGAGSRSGDAIVTSWVEASTGVRRVVVIDGGYQTNGEEIVKLVFDRFGRSFIDIVVSTHPDGDHSNGLAAILDECMVGELLMHLPWEHGASGSALFPGGRFADRSMREAVVKALDSTRVLAEEALEAGVAVTEPFTGLTRLGGVLEILGPTADFYESLLCGFRTESRSSGSRIAGSLLTKVGQVATRVAESLDVETLTDAGETSAENNSSAIVQLNVNDGRFVLTGDAGIPALDRAADRLVELGHDHTSLTLAQVPHHGSKRNVGPSVLDRLLGPRLGVGVQQRCAVVSAAPDGAPKHPARQVTNAFYRRGTPVWATQGQSLRYAIDAPLPGYTSVEPLPFYEEVDE